MTKKSELENLQNLINQALESRGQNTRVILRGAYGNVGLDKTDINHSVNIRHITPLITKKELRAYMLAALDGLWMFE